MKQNGGQTGSAQVWLINGKQVLEKLEEKLDRLNHQRDTALIIAERVLYRIENEGCEHFFDADFLKKQIEVLKAEIRADIVLCR